MTEVSKRNVNVYEVGRTPDGRYKELLAKIGVVDGSAKEKVKQTRNALGLHEVDMVLGQYKVNLKYLFVTRYQDSHRFMHHLGFLVSTRAPLPRGPYLCA